MERKRWPSSAGYAAQSPWLKLVYLDESRVHPFSRLCQKEDKRKWRTKKKALLCVPSQSSTPGVHSSCFHVSNGFLPWNDAERDRLDMTQLVQLKQFVYQCLKMLRLGEHV